MFVSHLTTARAERDDEIADTIALAGAMVDAIGSVVLAPKPVLRASVACLIAGGHLMIEDVPGVGKTMLARALAAAAGMSYARLQCTADLMPADVTGVSIYHQPTGNFDFRYGPIFANLVLVDEINRSSPRTQSALLEAMEEGQVTVDGATRPLPHPFMVVATHNPVEYEGTFPLPEAQLDRFMMRLHLGYPEPADEAALITGAAGAASLHALQPVASEAAVRRSIAAAECVHVDAAIADYVVSVATATRRDERLLLGASPRAGLALVRAARAWALTDGRDYILADDVVDLAPVVLSHRVVVSPTARTRARSTSDIVAEIVERVPAPPLR